MVHQIKANVRTFPEKEQLTYIGHIHQQIKKTILDNTFVQSYLYVADHAERLADAGNVVKVKFEELAGLRATQRENNCL